MTVRPPEIRTFIASFQVKTYLSSIHDFQIISNGITSYLQSSLKNQYVCCVCSSILAVIADCFTRAALGCAACLVLPGSVGDR